MQLASVIITLIALNNVIYITNRLYTTPRVGITNDSFTLYMAAVEENCTVIPPSQTTCFGACDCEDAICHTYWNYSDAIGLYVVPGGNETSPMCQFDGDWAVGLSIAMGGITALVILLAVLPRRIITSWPWIICMLVTLCCNCIIYILDGAVYVALPSIVQAFAFVYKCIWLLIAFDSPIEMFK